MLPAILVFILIILSYQAFLVNRFLPGIFVGDSNLSFKTKAEAHNLLSNKFTDRTNQTLEYTYNDTRFKINLANSVSVNLDSTLNQAFTTGRTGFFSLPFYKSQINPEINFDLEKQISPIAQSVNKPPKNASISPNLVVSPGEDGEALDQEALLLSIRNFISFNQSVKELPIKKASPEITNSKVNLAKTYLEKANADPVKLTFEENTWTLDGKTLLPLLNLKEGELIDQEKLDTYLLKVASIVNQPLKEALFNFNPDTGRVSSFQPAQEGRELDIGKTASLITLALEETRPKTITLPVNTIKPKIATDEVNDLGIKELIGRGVSHFAGSIPNRAYNVRLTAAKINGVLIPPGQVFSFNQTVGDISAATGFKQAYVIKEGRTVLDDGGGVCQDSTTIFRAALNAGLPIVKRTAHAYRVGYYEQGFAPGLDATVFYPSVDFQFKNDTAHHILVQAHTIGTTLTIDLYGTGDGRTVSMSNPVIASQTPPPPELRQDDPTLPKGTVKQVDWAAWGAQVSFNRTVTRDGKAIISETWRSNYRPWQAIFLVGSQ